MLIRKDFGDGCIQLAHTHASIIEIVALLQQYRIVQSDNCIFLHIEDAPVLYLIGDSVAREHRICRMGMEKHWKIKKTVNLRHKNHARILLDGSATEEDRNRAMELVKRLVINFSEVLRCQMVPLLQEARPERRLS
jgi:hypothetical protein